MNIQYVKAKPTGGRKWIIVATLPDGAYQGEAIGKEALEATFIGGIVKWTDGWYAVDFKMDSNIEATYHISRAKIVAMTSIQQARFLAKNKKERGLL